MKPENIDIDEDVLDLALIEQSRSEAGEDISLEEYRKRLVKRTEESEDIKSNR